MRWIMLVQLRTVKRLAAQAGRGTPKEARTTGLEKIADPLSGLLLEVGHVDRHRAAKVEVWGSLAPHFLGRLGEAVSMSRPKSQPSARPLRAGRCLPPASRRLPDSRGPAADE